ncbi:MAG: hypothetical protein ACT4OZ_05280 [Gemmatimonadota bacterium]
MFRAGLTSFATLALLSGARPAHAQVRSFTSPPAPQRPETPVPAQFMPPPGMCRIWLDNVPPAQQPAPTDCATAIRRKPQNARVIFGPREATRDNRETPRDTTRRKPDSID